MRKSIYTLNIEYDQRVTSLTYPYLRRYAERIGAEFRIIDTRKFPTYPVVYEKLQIYELSRENMDDWIFYLDSDALVHPETPDFTEFVPRDTVCHHGSDMAAIRWDYDNFFRRDGRNIGSCNWCTLASSWCRDLWRPIDDLTLEEILPRIHPTVNEVNTVITRDHLIDDYALSRNIARFGLHFTTIMELLPKINLTGSNFFWHQYTIPLEEKIKQLTEIIAQWQLPQPPGGNNGQ